MFCDDLKAIVLWNTEAIEQRLINDLTGLRAVFRRLAFQKIDPDERHGSS
jgi:hypothetical protein